MTAPHRFTDAALPSTRFVPERSRREDARPPDLPVIRSPEDFERVVLVGVDLYNHGYFWEAHEAWERAWVARRSRAAVAALCKGLIQTAACALKAEVGRPVGVARLRDRALALFQTAEPAFDEPPFNRLALTGFVRDLAAFDGAGDAQPPQLRPR